MQKQAAEYDASMDELFSMIEKQARENAGRVKKRKWPGPVCYCHFSIQIKQYIFFEQGTCMFS
ncbi:hypothetical protein PN4B1_47530 [Paenibacillus naphthalenovorans]|nr:hypothetical protein PN4B1_47530 [Paenibacillus naphthalenovorans]